MGFPVFVKISRLAAGTHTLCVKARKVDHSSVTPASPAAAGVVTLEVREPEPWIAGTTSHTGLAISLDPHDPGLDTFWEGDVDISILGPEGHRVTCAISLASGNGKELLSKRIGTFDLPVAAGAWQRKLGQFLQDEDCAWAYLEATSGQFVIKGDELGSMFVGWRGTSSPFAGFAAASIA